MVKLSTIKVLFVFAVLIAVAFLFMKKHVSEYYEGPMTIVVDTPAHD